MEKIKEGALFAVGFTLVAITLGFAYTFVASKMIESSVGLGSRSTDDIAILESRLVKREERLVVLGKYANTGDYDWNTLIIQANFFDEDGSILDQCKQYSAGALPAGEEAYFRLECSSCADLTLDDVANHQVFVANGY